jgi:pyridinium-3,5-biscarboxylic acid mononucleotide sulfurtransferase
MALNKLDKLKEILKKCSKVIVAFSGGVDSCFLLYYSVEFLGKENVTAVTGISDTYTNDEMKFAEDFAKNLNIKHILVETDEFSNTDFINNPKERCYYCKKELYSEILKIASERNIEHILDGTTASDLTDYRPGKKASLEAGVKSPLLDAGFTKDEIRIILREKGFPFWDKPANPCLASRIPYNSKITREKLLQIEKGEIFLKNLGFKTVRVRNHSELARIEVPESEINSILNIELRSKINSYFQELGFTWVAVDLKGFRTGSMNEILK